MTIMLLINPNKKDVLVTSFFSTDGLYKLRSQSDVVQNNQRRNKEIATLFNLLTYPLYNARVKCV